MGGVVSTVIKLAIVCFLVGLLLAFFDVDPVSLMRHLPDTVYAIFETLLGWTRRAVPYIMLGAIVVIPIWIIRVLLRAARNRRSS